MVLFNGLLMPGHNDEIHLTKSILEDKLPSQKGNLHSNCSFILLLFLLINFEILMRQIRDSHVTKACLKFKKVPTD